MKEADAQPKRIAIGRAFRLWVGMLLAPVAWIAQLQALYLTSEFGCASADFTMNHVVTGAAFLVAMVGMAAAFSEFSAARFNPDDDSDLQFLRSRFMGMIGILTSSLFAVLIVAQWLPTAVGVPCGK